MQTVAPAPVAAPDAPVPSSGTAHRWLPVVLAVLVGCGTVHSVLAPGADSPLTREARLEVLFADVDRGLVDVVYQDGAHVLWRPEGAWTWSSAPMQGFGRDNRALNGLHDVLQEAAAVNRDAEIDVGTRSGLWAPLQLAGGIGLVGAFLLLIAGPDPRRATRWGWFWLSMLGRSAGLGALAFLLLGARPARRRSTAGQHRAEAERIDGFQGFAIAFVAGLALSVLGALAMEALVGDRSGEASYTYDLGADDR
jgi:hypothetical protein